MRYLYLEEFLKQKLPSMEEYNKRFGVRYRGIDYVFENARRYYHILDRALPLVQEETFSENSNEDDADYYFNEPEPQSPQFYDFEQEIKENKRRAKKAKRKRLIKKGLNILKSIIKSQLKK
jgi:hypothetical protein